jgi:GTP:adenosylcobinamide-phosphate guanylyltransferase
MTKELKDVTGTDKKNVDKRPRNKQGLIFTDDMLKELAKVAPYLTWQHIADYFKINQETLYNILARDPRVSEVYKKAKAKKIYLFGKKLRDKAMGKCPEADTGALIFYLKVHGRWKDNIEQPDINVNVNLISDEQKAQRELDIKLYAKYRRDMGFGIDGETAVDAKFTVEDTKKIESE